MTEKSYIAKENINIGDSSFVYWRTRKEIKFNNKTIKKKDVRTTVEVYQIIHFIGPIL